MIYLIVKQPKKHNSGLNKEERLDIFHHVNAHELEGELELDGKKVPIAVRRGILLESLKESQSVESFLYDVLHTYFSENNAWVNKLVPPKEKTLIPEREWGFYDKAADVFYQLRDKIFNSRAT